MPSWWPPSWWPWQSRELISLLVPYREDRLSPDRTHIWEWLQQYWRFHLPRSEIVMGRDWSPRQRTFSKARAVNNAARRARGDIFVILDADTYFEADVIRECASRIRTSRVHDEPLWFIPYRHIYRLTEETSARILNSFPENPLKIAHPPLDSDVESTLGSAHGHRFGAMIQIMPREAFEQVGGMDERFVGWGGEDVSFVRAVDTLYGNHKTTDNDVLHIWHTKIGITHQERMWERQKVPRANDLLASRYNMATGDRERMRSLANENRRRWYQWWRRLRRP